jgi:hypothetical protein
LCQNSFPNIIPARLFHSFLVIFISQATLQHKEIVLFSYPSPDLASRKKSFMRVTVGGHRVLRVKNSFMESPFLLPNSVLTLCGLSKNYSQDIKRQVIEVIDGRRQAQT